MNKINQRKLLELSMNDMKQIDSLKVTSSEFAQFCVHRCTSRNMFWIFDRIAPKTYILLGNQE